jgi:hypothetical protein
MLVLAAWAVLNVGSGIVMFEAAGRVSGIVLSIVLALEGLGGLPHRRDAAHGGGVRAAADRPYLG